MLHFKNRVRSILRRFLLKARGTFLSLPRPKPVSNEELYSSLDRKSEAFKLISKYLSMKDYSSADRELLNYFRNRVKPGFFYDAKSRHEIVWHIKESFDSSVKKTIEKADQVSQHVFDLLGSGPLFLGEPINWHSDFKGNSWIRGYYRDLNAILYNNDFQNENYIGDIKLPWELNKHLRFIDLGKAYWLTEDEKYAEEFIKQLMDWINENPYQYNLGWTQNLIVSQRAISWCFSFVFFFHSQKFSGDVLNKFLKSILEHRKYIEEHLELAEKTSNHLIGNLSALFLVNFLFPEFEGADSKYKKSISMLIKEIDKQIYSDGVDYEQSISYHRYVLEFCLIPVILCRMNGIPLPERFLKKIEKMIEFILYISKPDGFVYPISDADGARVFNLNNAHINDYQSYLAVGAVLFDRGDFKSMAGENCEEVIWLLGPKGLEKYWDIQLTQPAVCSKAFWDGGYFILRDRWSTDAKQLFFDCGNIGMGYTDDGEYGTHGHSDLLNFGISAYGETFITDIGSGTYTGNKKVHDYFRSSAGHNTINIDGQDQSILTTTWAMKNRARPLKGECFTSQHFDYVSGAHDGYRRLSHPIIHRREILFVKPDYWIMVDSLLGRGYHHLEAFYHLSPGLDVDIDSADNLILIKGNRSSLLMAPFCSMSLKKALSEGSVDPFEGWISADYGQWLPAPVLKVSAEFQCPLVMITAFYPFPIFIEKIPKIEAIAFDGEEKISGIRIDTEDSSESFIIESIDRGDCSYKKTRGGQVQKMWIKRGSSFDEKILKLN